MENILGNKIAAIQTVSSVISSIQSQEALKFLFRVNGRNIGPPMDPPYVNYNGVYGQFDHLNILKRDDCLACGKIEGEENIQYGYTAVATTGQVLTQFNRYPDPKTPAYKMQDFGDQIDLWEGMDIKPDFRMLQDYCDREAISLIPFA